MPRRKKKKHRKPDSNYKEPPKRNFFVNKIFEFAFFYDPEVTDKREIIKKFRADKDWVWFEKYYKVKYKSSKFSDDLSEVYIVTTPKHKKI